jgi:hypothetical protein
MLGEYVLVVVKLSVGEPGLTKVLLGSGEIFVVNGMGCTCCSVIAVTLSLPALVT